MVKITFIHSNAKKTRYTLTIENELEINNYLISSDAYLRLNSPVRGTEISERAFMDICLEDETYKAIKKAYSFLCDMDRSKQTLKTKLMQVGFSSDACDAALDRCVELGYLNEYEQVERAVEREANYKLRGPYYIRRRLASKGYSVSDIDRAIGVLLERGDIDFNSSFERFCEKRGAKTEEEKTKLKYRFGYKI